MEKKPFTFGVATSGDNFTDREKETERLLLNFQYVVITGSKSPSLPPGSDCRSMVTKILPTK